MGYRVVCCITLAAAIFCHSAPAVAAVPPAERAALVTLYNSTAGANWTNKNNWLVGDPCANAWHGVICDGGPNIIALYLVQNNLVGNIPSDLGNLVNLTQLSLWSNQLSGPIPPELGNLTNLQELTLLQNQLSGPIPAELGSLVNLTLLSLWSNQLSGPIPPELGNPITYQPHRYPANGKGRCFGGTTKLETENCIATCNSDASSDWVTDFPD